MTDDDIPPALRRVHLLGAVGLVALLLAGVGWFAVHAGAFVGMVVETLRDFPPRQAAALLLADLEGLLPSAGQMPAAASLRVMALAGAGLGAAVVVVVWLAALRLAFAWTVSGLIHLRGDDGFHQGPPDFADPHAIAERTDRAGFTRARLSIAESLLAGPQGAFLRPGHEALARRLLRPAGTMLRALVRPVFYVVVTLAVLATLILGAQTGVPDPRQALNAAAQMLSQAASRPLMVWTALFLILGAAVAISDVAFMRALLPAPRQWQEPHRSPDISLHGLGSFEQVKRRLLTALRTGAPQVRIHVLRDGQTACDSFSDHSDVGLTLLVEGGDRVIEDHTHRAAALRAAAGLAMILAGVALILLVMPAGLLLDLLSGQPVPAAEVLPGVLHLVLSLGLARRLWSVGRRFMEEGAEVMDLLCHETPVAVLDIVGTVDRSVRRGHDPQARTDFEQQSQLVSLSVSLRAATLFSHSRGITGQRMPWASSGDPSGDALAQWLRGVVMSHETPGEPAPPARAQPVRQVAGTVDDPATFDDPRPDGFARRAQALP